MEIISSKLRCLLEEDDDEHFEDSLVIQEHVLPMLNKWTNIISLNQYDSQIDLSKSWNDLYDVLNRLPQSSLLLCISQTEYLLDIILQHIQIDTFDTDSTIWHLSSKCLLLFLENIGAAVWQETSSTAEDFFDNLLDIYQSTGISGANEHRSDRKPLQNLSCVVLVLELMMAMVLKPIHGSATSYSQPLVSIIANYIKDLMYYFQSELNSKHYSKVVKVFRRGHSDNLNGSNPISSISDSNDYNNNTNNNNTDNNHNNNNDNNNNTYNNVSSQKQNEQEFLKEELQHFCEIVESYFTDTTKNCRSLLLDEVASIQCRNNKNNNVNNNDKNNDKNNKNNNKNNSISNYNLKSSSNDDYSNYVKKYNISIDQLDDVVFVKSTKTVPENCFSIMLETLPIICDLENLLDYPDIVGHILSCHSHLCIIPEVCCSYMSLFLYHFLD